MGEVVDVVGFDGQAAPSRGLDPPDHFRQTRRVPADGDDVGARIGKDRTDFRADAL